MNVVTNISTLKAMEEKGFITLHPHTGRRMNNAFGAETKVCYVDEIPALFEFRGRRYGIKWVSGSFYPYVEDRGPVEGV